MKASLRGLSVLPARTSDMVAVGAFPEIGTYRTSSVARRLIERGTMAIAIPVATRLTTEVSWGASCAIWA